MRTSTKLLLLLLIAGLTPQAFAQGAGNCVTGTAISFISVNDVQASLFNTGGLFFGGSTTSGDGYLVPKASGNSPIFASGIWVAGTVDGDERVAAARYGGYDFWPGPLDENTGLPPNPNDCSEYDRIYNVTRQDILDYESGIAPARDLAEWPADLGAPVIDGDGDPTNYSLENGDRPEIIGDQGIWWVMNDAGNDHNPGAPLGIEIQALAWAFARADALGQTTFYRYRVINKNSVDITDAYISIFSDPDLGDAGDDYVGVDTTLSLGFVYNDSNEDSAYGSPPPAAGYDFFQGPIVGDDTLGATAFSTFINGGPDGTQDPGTPEEYRFYMQGLWGNGTPYYEFGTGFEQAGNPTTKFIYAGDPATREFYSEVNVDGAGTASPQGDRRLVISTGPFTLERGVPQDIVFGVVFAQGSDNLNSVAALRVADQLAQGAYDVGFDIASPPPPPPACNANSPNPELRPGSGGCAEATELDGQITLVWGYPSNSSNYLGQFEVENKLLADVPVEDKTYNFEGFNIYRYPTSDFQADQAELVATFDKINGVTKVIDQFRSADTGQLTPFVAVNGTDSGIQYAYDVRSLTNNTDYFYGITAYAHNEASSPKINESAPTQLTVRPRSLVGGTVAQSEFGDDFEVTAVQVGAGNVSARVVDPVAVTGDDYEVRFFNATDSNGNATEVTTYTVRNATTGAVLVDGQKYYDNNETALPLGQNLFVAEGLAFDVEGPAPGFENFQMVANANGPIVPPEGAIADYAGFPHEDDPRAGAGQQVGDAIWFFSTGGRSNYTQFLDRVLRGDNSDRVFPYDFEMRFTGTSIGAKDGIFGQSGANPTLPFELWRTGIATPDDPSDDIRMIPIFLDIDDDGTYNLSTADSPLSSADNDPETDWIYWYDPVDMTPGESGYLAYENGGALDLAQIGGEVLARTTWVGWNLGTAPPYALPYPEAGSILRIRTFKPNQPGDTFTFSTAGSDLSEPTAQEAEAALDRIAMVPNPYMGESDYETGNLSRVVRITNLPSEATTIQIYTVAGTLVRTLRKEGASRTLEWDMQTQSGLPVASGMYLVRVEVAGVGERILKFGLVNRRSRITLF
ncbi:MAG: hypothetical protein Rubg2KO_35300 [Rubricoccaceae bacterium]